MELFCTCDLARSKRHDQRYELWVNEPSFDRENGWWLHGTQRPLFYVEFSAFWKVFEEEPPRPGECIIVRVSGEVLINES